MLLLGNKLGSLGGLSQGSTDAFVARIIDDDLAAMAGDFHLDGDVDGRDLLLWQQNPSVGQLSDWQCNCGHTESIPGDSGLDGDADGRDFLLWERGQSPSPLSAQIWLTGKRIMAAVERRAATCR